MLIRYVSLSMPGKVVPMSRRPNKIYDVHDTINSQ